VNRLHKVLIVSRSVPPALTGSASIVDNLRRSFSSQEMVVAGEAPPGERSLESSGGEDLPRIHYVGASIRWLRRGRRWLAPLHWPLLVRKVRHLLQRENCDGVVAVFPDEYYFAAAYFAARQCRVPLIPYFHNTWLDNTQGWRRTIASKSQPRVISYASRTLAISDGLRDFLASQYPGTACETLVHSLTDEVPEPIDLPRIDGPLKIVFLGNLNESNADAMRRFAEVLPKLRDWRLTIYSGMHAGVFRAHGFVGPNVHITSAAPCDVVASLRRHDVLLLPHGLHGGLSDVEYRTIFPTRTISYLFAGRPILAHTPTDAFLTHWLRRHDAAEIVDQADGDALLASLERLRSDVALRRQCVSGALQAAPQFQARVVAQRFRDLVGLAAANQTLPRRAPLMAAADLVKSPPS
jgi:hypothetical protein